MHQDWFDIRNPDTYRGKPVEELAVPPLEYVTLLEVSYFHLTIGCGSPRENDHALESLLEAAFHPLGCLELMLRGLPPLTIETVAVQVPPYSFEPYQSQAYLGPPKCQLIPNDPRGE